MRRGRLVAALAAAIFLLFALPSAANAITGAIVGGTANSTWTQGHVDAVSVTMDLCGSDGAPDCKWAGLAAVMPAANGNCPNDWYNDGPAVGLQTFWGSGYQSANGTVTSGPQDFTLNGAYGQRVCVYLERTFTLLGSRASWVVASKLLQQPSPPPPPPPPPAPPAPPPTPNCTVPSLVGLTLADANSSLAAAHCTLGTVRRTYSTLVRSGLVISQGRTPGTMLADGAPIDAAVSLGPEPKCRVPAVVGMPLKQAQRTLRAAHCVLGMVRHKYSQRVKKGRVMSQSRRRGTSLPTRTHIDVVVSRGRGPLARTAPLGASRRGFVLRG